MVDRVDGSRDASEKLVAFQGVLRASNVPLLEHHAYHNADCKSRKHVGLSDASDMLHPQEGKHCHFRGSILDIQLHAPSFYNEVATLSSCLCPFYTHRRHDELQTSQDEAAYEWRFEILACIVRNRIQWAQKQESSLQSSRTSSFCC
jgi:hypothetical protein